MASLRQLEDAVENAFITQLSANAEVVAQGWTVRHWQDASNAKNQKSIVVYCSGMANTAVDRTRQGELYEGSVELGAMVVEGIRNNSPYIITHAEFRDEVRDIYRVIDEAIPKDQEVPPGRKAFEDFRRSIGEEASKYPVKDWQQWESDKWIC